jgi:hypothetical protein
MLSFLFVILILGVALLVLTIQDKLAESDGFFFKSKTIVNGVGGQ